jgi:hypothetical protein
VCTPGIHKFHTVNEEHGASVGRCLRNRRGVSLSAAHDQRLLLFRRRMAEERGLWSPAVPRWFDEEDDSCRSTPKPACSDRKALLHDVLIVIPGSVLCLVLIALGTFVVVRTSSGG